MGIHPNHFWGNLYPSKHERDFMSKLKKTLFELNSYKELSCLLMIFKHLMMEENFKVIQRN